MLQIVATAMSGESNGKNIIANGYCRIELYEKAWHFDDVVFWRRRISCDNLHQRSRKAPDGLPYTSRRKASINLKLGGSADVSDSNEKMCTFRRLPRVFALNPTVAGEKCSQRNKIDLIPG